MLTNVKLAADAASLPVELLELLEQDKLIFFCGAGISYAAGLPLFEPLTCSVSAALHANSINTELEEKSFDSAFRVLEEQFGSEKVRKLVHSKLSSPKLDDSSTLNHQSLLALATNRDKVLRLVTTNFDRIFEHCLEQKENQSVRRYNAPLVPPARSVWNGLVYLHGLLPVNPDDQALKELVLNSADFGRAYLLDGWAARFLVLLMRNYSICFVGYRINDAVVRLITDALAQEKQLGHEIPPHFAFVPCNESSSWRNKPITAIKYSENNHHAELATTLHRWANLHCEAAAKTKLVQCLSASELANPCREDDNAVLWALRDPSAARAFRDHGKAASLDWLDLMESEGLLSLADIRQPNRLEGVKLALAQWLCSHWSDPKLILKIFASNSYRWSLSLCDQIQHQLRSNEHIDPDLSRLWQLAILGKIGQDHSFAKVARRALNSGDGLTMIALLKLLEPTITIQDASYRASNRSGIWKTIIAKVECHHAMPAMLTREVLERSDSSKVLAESILHLNSLLTKALELLRDANGSRFEQESYSRFECNEVTMSAQPKRYLSCLIKLLRSAWQHAHSSNKPKAQTWLAIWRSSPWQLHQRLALSCAAEPRLMDPNEVAEWLLENDGQFLGESFARPEAFLLFKAYVDQFEEGHWQRMLAFLLAQKSITLRGDVLDRPTEAALAFLRQAESSGRTFNAFAHPILATSTPSSNQPDLSFNQVRSVRKDALPESRLFLIKALQIREQRQFMHDDWRDICINQPVLAYVALKTAWRKGTFLESAWRNALSNWSNGEELNERILSRLVDLFLALATEQLEKISIAVSSFLVAQRYRIDHPGRLKLCNHLFEVTNDQTSRVNIALSLVAFGPEGLSMLDAAFEEPRLDEETLAVVAAELAQEWLTDSTRFARHIAPRASPGNTSAKEFWSTLLSCALIDSSIVAKLKSEFLSLARTVSKLTAEQIDLYAETLLECLEQDSKFFEPDLLRQAIKDGGDNLASRLLTLSFWKLDSDNQFWSRVLWPLIQNSWPQEIAFQHSISHHWAEICAAAGPCFPEAFDALQYWLKRSELNAQAYDILDRHNIVSDFPAEMATFMDRITPDEFSNEPLGFREVVNAVANWSNSQNAQVERLRRIANSWMN
jgi:hypothetical protein